MTSPSDDPLAPFRAAASPERAELLTPIAGGHIFRGTWEALADLDTATCAACGEHIKEGGEAAEVVEHDGAGVAHRIMCDGWSTTAPPGVLLPLARGLTRQRVAPDDAGDLLPSRASHEAQVELYSAHWDASRDAVSRPLADAKATLFHIGNAFDALCAALSDEEHALRMALEHDERARVSGSAPPGEVPSEMTAERLDELDRLAREAHRRAAKATVGPWTAAGGCVRPPDGIDRGPVKALLDKEILIAAGTAGECDANSAFAAAAREDVPVLSAAVLALSAEVRRLREPPAADDLSELEKKVRELKADAEKVMATDDYAISYTLVSNELALLGEEVPELADGALRAIAEARRLRGESAAPGDLAAIEAAAREDKTVASRATRRPWKWWTANSRRELRSEAGRRSETVAYGQQHPHDRVIDIAIQELDMALIERAVNGLEERTDALLRLAGEVRRLREGNARMRPVVDAARAWGDTDEHDEVGGLAGQLAIAQALGDYAKASVEPPRAGEEPTPGESEEHVIEFRSGTFFQSLDTDNGGPAKTAQRFASRDEADAFIQAHAWIAFNGGMPYPLERALRGAKQS